MIRRKQRTDSFSSLKHVVDEESLKEESLKEESLKEESLKEGQTNSVFTSDPSVDEDWCGRKESDRIKYQRLQDDNHGFLPAQFESPDVQVPVKAIILASFLFLAGFAAIAFGSLSLLGYLDRIPDTGPIVMLVLGLLMFIPGSYHVMIAYYAFKDEPGYSFDDIPDFN